VVGNTVTNTTQDGIFIYPGGDGSPPPPAGVSVAQNSISNIGRHGIFASGVDVQLEQNDIANCAEGGIYAAAGVSIIGNVINVAHPGILVEAKSSAIIRDNVLTDAWEIVYLH
jgi:putative cofactor-binding repeat protein